LASAIATAQKVAQRSSRSVRTHLVWLVILLVVPFVLLFGYAVAAGASAAVGTTEDAARVLAETVSAYAAQHVADTAGMLERLARRPLVRALDPAHCDPLLANIQAAFPDFTNVSTRNAQGTLICSNPRQPGEAVDEPVNDDALTSRVLREGRFVIGMPTVGSISGRWTALSAVPLRDDAGRVIGTVSMPVDLGSLQDAVTGLNLAPGIRVAVIEDTGTVIAITGDIANLLGTNIRGVPTVQQALAASGPGRGEGIGIDGSRRLIGFAPVVGADWHVIASFPQDVAEAHARQTLVDGGLVGLAVLLAVAFLATRLSRRIERPAHALAEVVTAVRAGRTDARVTPGGPQELMIVGEELNAMLDAQEHLHAAEHSARTQAEAAVRSRDEFLAVAAHELKTPVSGLHTFAQMLGRVLARSGELDSARLQTAAVALDRETGKIGRLVDQLLDISRIEAGQLRLEPTWVDLTMLAGGAAESARARAEGLKVDIVLRAPDPVLVWSDPLRMEQVFANLLDNALKYAAQGRRIEVDVEAPEQTTAWVRVRDFGSGIPPALRAGLFTRFYQAHAEHHVSGLGLGLYISRQIVKLHGGQIEALFPSGGGTCFVVTLPIAPALAVIPLGPGVIADGHAIQTLQTLGPPE
jgi:signal transduction histidine kinase